MTTLVLQPPEATQVDAVMLSTGTHSYISTEIQVGIHYGGRRRALFAWDLTSLPDSALISAATMTLKSLGADSITVDTDVAVYLVTETGMTEAATWTNYDGSSAWASAGGYTTTGGVVTTVSPDGDLVVSGDALVSLIDNAIASSSGILRILIGTTEELTGTPTGSKRIKYHSSNASASANHPKLSIEYISVTSWTGGASDGNANTAGNWSTGLPDATSRVVVNSTADAITTPGGGLRCDRLYFGPKFQGSFGTSATPATVQANYVYVESTSSTVHLAHSKWTESSELSIINTPRSTDRVGFDGDFGTLHVIGTGRSVPVDSNETLTVYTGAVRTSQVDLDAGSTNVVYCGERSTVNNYGTCTVAEVHNGGKLLLSDDNRVGTLHATGTSVVDFRSVGITTGGVVGRDATLDMRKSDKTKATLAGLEIHHGGKAFCYNGIEAVDMTSNSVVLFGGRVWFDEGIAVNRFGRCTLIGGFSGYGSRNSKHKPNVIGS